MDYTIVLSITAIIISGLSLLFVILQQHIGFGLEFRESEITSKRKKEILVALNKEIVQDITSFVSTCNEKKTVDEDIKNSIDELSSKHNRVTLGNELLDSTTHFFNRFVRYVIFTALIIISAIIFLYIEYPLVTTTGFVFFALLFVVFIYMIARISYQNLCWYVNVRDAFLKLSEEPTLNNAKNIAEYLNNDGVPYVLSRET
jgi:hypothetical protein